MKEIILKNIKECKLLFDKDKVKSTYKEHAYFYLGVFDVLFGLYFEEGDSLFKYVENEDLTTWMDSIITEFLKNK